MDAKNTKYKNAKNDNFFWVHDTPFPRVNLIFPVFWRVNDKEEKVHPGGAPHLQLAFFCVCGFFFVSPF